MARKRRQNPDSGNEPRSGLTQIMGELEAEVLECVWDLGSASVKDVHECLLERREIAYTTVMTVLARLTAKGLLVARAVGRAYVYEATAGREEFCAGVVREFMSGVLADADRAVLTQFVESVTERDMQQLDLLARIIEEKRQDTSSSP